jgi:hypothetical protein
MDFPPGAGCVIFLLVHSILNEHSTRETTFRVGGETHLTKGDLKMGTLTEAVEQTDKKGPTAELVDKINVGHQEIVGASKDIIEKACATGKLLLEAKNRVKHGDWQKWMADNLRFTERTAQKYMLIATHEKKWRGKTDSESDLTLQGVTDFINERIKPQKAVSSSSSKKTATAKRAPVAAHAKFTPPEVTAPAESPAIVDDDDHQIEIEVVGDRPDKALAELKWAINHWVPKLTDDQLPAIKQYFDELVDKRIAAGNAKKATRMLEQAA